MTIPLAKKIDGKKFMWDGLTYESWEKAEEAMAGYQQDGFETHLVAEDGQYLVYSRRVATVQGEG